MPADAGRAPSQTSRQNAVGTSYAASIRHPQAALVGSGDQPHQVVLVPQPGVDAEVVGGVVAEGLRGEHRPEHKALDPERDRVVEPGIEQLQPMLIGAHSGRADGSALRKPSG